MLDSLLTAIKYGAVFSGIYVQVFLLFTYLGWGSGRPEENDQMFPENNLPTIGVIVPAYNEEVGVVRTVESLLNSDYPNHKLQIIVVDDGSKDGTWTILQKYADNPRVSLYTKENGGKYTALNLGLEKTTADIVGCLDADSTIAVDAIRQSAKYFLRDPETKAVVPTMTVDNPKTLIQFIQKVEFESALYMREVFGRLGTLFVAPGPLTLFRREVFDILGPYRHGYLGEDLEIAVRMQFNNMKIVYGNNVRIYTFGMKTLKTLLKQRVRWTYAFIMNMKDYRAMLFNPKYGHLGLFILPIAILGIILAIILTPIAIVQIFKSGLIYTQPLIWGVHPKFEFDPFYLNSKSLTILALIALVFAISTVLIGRSLNKQKLWSFDLWTIIIYPFISTLWMLKTFWKMMRSEKVTWR